MSNLFSMENPIISGIIKVMNCILLTILWLICCIPVFTVGAATVALFSTVWKTLIHDRGYVSSQFFSSFRDNFKQATVVWLSFGGVALIFLGDINILRAIADNGHVWGNVYTIFQLLLVIECIYAVHVFSYMARFKNTIKETLKNTGLLMLRHPLTLLKVTAVLLFGSVLIYIIPLLIFIMPTLIVWLISVPLERLYYRYMSPEQQAEENIRNADYRNK